MSDICPICIRCDRGIRDGERYDRHDHDRPTGAPLVTYSHRGACPDPKAPVADAHALAPAAG